jgi:hypothetical protein
MAALAGDKILAQLAQEFEVHPIALIRSGTGYDLFVSPKVLLT